MNHVGLQKVLDTKSMGGCEFGCVFSLDVTTSSFPFHKICFHVRDTLQFCRSECRRKGNLLRLMPGWPCGCALTIECILYEHHAFNFFIFLISFLCCASRIAYWGPYTSLFLVSIRYILRLF